MNAAIKKTLGVVLIVVGIAGLFLPLIQGILLILLGVTLLKHDAVGDVYQKFKKSFRKNK